MKSNKICFLVSLFVMFCMFASCSNKTADVVLDSSNQNVIMGEVLSVYQNSILVEVLVGLSEKKAIIYIDEELTVFNQNVSKDFNKGNIVEFKVFDKIMESQPIQATAFEIISNINEHKELNDVTNKIVNNNQDTFYTDKQLSNCIIYN